MCEICEKSLVVYKNRPALVIETGEKITISILGGEKLKVRAKDIDFLHSGPCNLLDLEKNILHGDTQSAWELLGDNQTTLEELAELIYGKYSAQSAWQTYQTLKDGLYFSGEINEIKGKTNDEVKQEKQKRTEKLQGQEERTEFLKRFKEKKLNFPEDARFLQDVEALAYGKTDKSKTLKDLGKAETPEAAHKLLLEIGFWTYDVNPHPIRFDLPLFSAKTPIHRPPKDEERLDLTHLNSFAIDNMWSTDPDDAISIDGDNIWVHIADIAAVVKPESPADIEARLRGATLYLPEGAFRMISETALPLFALGLETISPALSFRIRLNNDFSIAETEIFLSQIRVTRLTYHNADNLIEDNSSELKKLYKISRGIIERRFEGGAISIEFPEAHITVSEGKVSIEQMPSYKSMAIVREFMLLAGEGVAKWALERRLSFPFISQEAGDLPNEVSGGLAGYYQVRRCMRPRLLSTKPGIHWGLGLDVYSQVTSPLRRYIDLLAHQQIRAFLKNETPLNEEEVLLRLNAGDVGASVISQAERASRAHWTAVYLKDKIESTWMAIVLEKKGARSVVIIPDLGLETQVALKKDAEPNETVTLMLSSVKIPTLEFIFVAV